MHHDTITKKNLSSHVLPPTNKHGPLQQSVVSPLHSKSWQKLTKSPIITYFLFAPWFWSSKVWLYLAPRLFFCLFLFRFPFGAEILPAKNQYFSCSSAVLKKYFCAGMSTFSTTVHHFMLRMKTTQLSTRFRYCFLPSPESCSMSPTDPVHGRQCAKEICIFSSPAF